MALHLYSIHHHEHGLEAVERVSSAVPGLAERLTALHGVSGAVVVSTCNRVEVYLDAESSAHQHVAQLIEAPWRVRHATEVLWHLFEVAAGLDSLVVGEREIAGQLRRALRAAHRDGTASHLLTESIEQSLRTSRRVAHLTHLADNGRSVVSVGLDLLRREWASDRVLLLGTGAYAGAVVAALHQRGCTTIAVHSASGRAASFAASHHVDAVQGELSDALASADVVVACRGVGTPVLTVATVQSALAARDGRGLDIVDLALSRDAESGVGALRGVRLVDLAVVAEHVPDASSREVSRAERIVAEGVEDLVARLKGRQLDPAVVALRDSVSTMVDDEIARLPQGRPLSADEAAHALRRLAARLIHEPSVRARRAGEAGRGDAYLAALSELYGIEASMGTPPHEPIDPDSYDTQKCPYAGYDLDDLGDHAGHGALAGVAHLGVPGREAV